MKKRFKKLVIAMFCIMMLTTNQTFAHTGDVYDGEYMSSSPYSQSLLKLLVDTSAITETLTMSMYQEALDWNNISSDVEVSVTRFYYGMSDAGFTYIRGTTWVDENKQGETVPRDANGNICGSNDNWYSVTIYIDIASDAFLGSNDPEGYAIKTIIHEVGHALKLAHPTINSNYTGHTYSGRPLAIMNQGNIDYDYVPTSVQTHDRDNLIYKWGN